MGSEQWLGVNEGSTKPCPVLESNSCVQYMCSIMKQRCITAYNSMASQATSIVNATPGYMSIPTLGPSRQQRRHSDLNTHPSPLLYFQPSKKMMDVIPQNTHTHTHPRRGEHKSTLDHKRGRCNRTRLFVCSTSTVGSNRNPCGETRKRGKFNGGRTRSGNLLHPLPSFSTWNHNTVFSFNSFFLLATAMDR